MRALGESLFVPRFALGPWRCADISQARCRLRTTPANGLTACRMRLHMPYLGFGTYRPPRQLRPYAHTDAYRELRAFAPLSMARSDGR
jgi:hypothetical protein